MKRRFVIRAAVAMLLAGLPAAVCLGGDDLDQALDVLVNSDAETPSAQLATAWKRVSEAGAEELERVLTAMDHAKPLAANWISSAVDAIVQRNNNRHLAVPPQMLRRFALQADHSPLARRTALECLRRQNPDQAEELIPEFLNDPAAEMRKPAVAQLMEQARQLATDGGSQDMQREIYQRALQAARDEQQIQQIATALKPLGQELDLANHFGYLQDWLVLGPFDNTDGLGYDAVYPVESLNAKTFDRQATFDGKEGPVRWKQYTTTADNGDVDLNTALDDLVDVVGYAATIVDSPIARDVQLRLRIQNSFKIWVNGQLLMAQPIGHTGNSFDQYVVNARLDSGPNLILIKSCQIKPLQEIPFFKVWHVCARVTDNTGAAILREDSKP